MHMLGEYLLVLLVAPAVALAAGAAVVASLFALLGPGVAFAFAPPLVTLALAVLTGWFAAWRCEFAGDQVDPFLCVGTISTVFGTLAVLLVLYSPVLSGEEHLILLAVAVAGPFLGARFRRRQSRA